MPVSTRQTTPGSSHASPTISHPQIHSINTRKRSGSEAQDDTRDPKKLKVDVGHLSSVNGKDKRKRRKRKKKFSVVIPGPVQTARSKSRSVPFLSNKQRTIPSHGLVKSGTTTLDEEEGPLTSSSDKGKGKAKSEPPSQPLSPLPSTPAQPIASGSSPSPMITPDLTAQASEITRLKEELAAQNRLLGRHQTHLLQHQQSLTCQICLDLMYKPYALAPCGHTTCYGCLVRWFMAPINPEIAPGMAVDNAVATENANLETILDSAQARTGVFIRRRKNCPVCRAAVTDRPIEMWGIKGMVSAFVRSGLGDLPVPAQSNAHAIDEGANPDPWRNIFRKPGSTRHWLDGAMAAAFHPPQPPGNQADGDREQMGWHDAEDGGVYRCIECYHEIWGGVCTHCNRGYPGHARLDDDDDEEDDDSEIAREVHNFLGRRVLMAEFTDEDEDEDEDEGENEDDLWHERDRHRRIAEGWPIHDGDWSDSEDELEELGEPELLHYHPFHPQLQYAPFYPPDDDEDSEYGGSFIDDGNHEEGYEQSGDEVEFVDDGPALQQRLGRRVIVDEEDQEEEEDHNPRLAARRLGRGTRLPRRVEGPLGHDSESEGSGPELDLDEVEEDLRVPEQHERRRVFPRRIYSDDEEDLEW